ncbi:MAG: PAS domain S-box protein [Pyrinomonadaceae bacterium]
MMGGELEQFSSAAEGEPGGVEERYRAFIANSSEGIWCCEMERPVPINVSEDEQVELFYRHGYLAECNDAMARMYGFSRADELTGARLDDFLPPSQPANLAYLRQFIHAGYRLTDAESDEADRDGLQKYFLNNLTGVVEEGMLRRIWGTQRDITEQKQAEQRLALLYGITRLITEEPTPGDAAPRVLQLICESMGWEEGALWQLDSEAGVLRCHDVWHEPSLRLTEFVGASRRMALKPGEGLPGRVWTARKPEWIQDVTTHTNFPRAPFAVHEGLHSAAAFPLLRGGVVVGVMEFFCREFRPPNEYMLQVLLAVGSQIGQLIERWQAERALRESAERYRTLAEAASDAIITIDQDSRILFANPATERIFGYPADELQGLDLALLMPDYMRELHHSGVANYVRTGKRHVSWDGIELPGLRRDGTIIPLEVSFGEFAHGDRRMFTGIARDISERKRIEVEREQLLAREQDAREKAEEANRLKDEFLATVSHELRTPLTAIIGWLFIVRSHHLDERGTDNALEIIERNAQAQSQLIEDLLDVTRITTGKLRLDLLPVRPAAFIGGAIDAARPAAAAKGISLHERIEAGGDDLIQGEAARLQQIIWNLLSNAVKFTPVGGRVEISARRAGDVYEIVVRDTGAGIAPEVLPHVFERFRQADSSMTREHGGLGLGLSIVRHLAELHGGTVRAESSGEGRGSTFTLRLPLLQPAAEDEQPGEGGLLPAAGPLPLAGLRLLVVDDDEDTLRMLEYVFRKFGAEVAAASSTTVAFELLKRTRPQALVCDLGMPEEDGYSFIRRVRSIEDAELRDVPAVALTAYAGAEERARAAHAGFQQHVPKPVDPAELVSLIVRLTARAIG